MVIDLNCDMGEGIGHDEQLMPFISSANIACGFHAGNYSVMNDTVKLAKKFNVAVGAHPSFPDKENYGRTNMNLTVKEIYELMLYQMGSLHAIAKVNSVTMHHVKPHGALYNMAAVNMEYADAIVDAIIDFDSTLILYGLANSKMIDSAKAKGIKYFAEAFADRTYQADGTLTSRSQPNALIDSEDVATKQVLQMINQKSVKATNGAIIQLQADTICLHGDGQRALSFAKALNHSLNESGIKISFLR